MRRDWAGPLGGLISACPDGTGPSQELKGPPCRCAAAITGSLWLVVGVATRALSDYSVTWGQHLRVVSNGHATVAFPGGLT